MRRRYASPYASSFSFGPGPLSSALKAIIAACVAIFVLQQFLPITEPLGLVSIAAVRQLQLWRIVTYMFLHGGIFHILFNMLALWMFGTELERLWGTRNFLKFYFTCGVGAGALTVLFSLLPFDFARALLYSNVIGASGAIYGLLLAYAMTYPERPILLLVFWVPAKICVAILGGIALFASISGPGGVANATHLGGLVIAYFYLKSARMHPLAELKYRYLKWKINRVRKKFDVYSGGRDYDRRIH
jgi:membrane associated rhomboid family serine protease